MAWDTFGEANGAATREELRARLARLSPRARGPLDLDAEIGCISIAFPPSSRPTMGAADAGRKRNIVSGRAYDLTSGPGRELWDACTARAVAPTAQPWMQEADEQLRYGSPQVIIPRLGQASFRLAVFDAYGSKCASRPSTRCRCSRRRIPSPSARVERMKSATDSRSAVTYIACSTSGL